MNPVIIRLSIMMFLEFFVWGAWYVSLGGFNTEAGMKGFNQAAFTVGPLAAILSPLFLGLVADRFFRSERVLGVLHLLGAGLLLLAPRMTTPQSDDIGFIEQFTHPYIWVLLAYMLCFMPTLALTASVAFKHLTNSEKQFPIVRVLGTIGWIVGGWMMWGARLVSGEAGPLASAQAALAAARTSTDAAKITLAEQDLTALQQTMTFSDNSPHIFTAAAIGSLLLGLYCFTLPKTPPTQKGEPASLGKLLGFDALVLFKSFPFAVFMFASFLICIPLAGYYANAYMFADAMKVSFLGSTTGAMSTGQMSEIFFMLIMPLCFARLGVKWMLAIGMAAWALRYVLFSLSFTSGTISLILIGILLHGICYDFFFVTGMIYTDKKAPPAIRNQAQGLLVLITQGLGLGIGAQVFFVLVNTFSEKTMQEGVEVTTYQWDQIWMYPAAFAVLVLIFFVVAFRDRKVEDTVR